VCTVEDQFGDTESMLCRSHIHEEYEMAWRKISLVGLESTKNKELKEVFVTPVPGGDEVCMVEDQFGDTKLMEDQLSWAGEHEE
jgi:hypothetical protein